MKNRPALLARVLALTWAGFWMFFFVTESVAWHTPVRMALLWAAVGLLFICLALVPWRWEGIGGILLMLVGLSAGVAYAIWSPPQLPAVSRGLTTAFFSAPPVVAGVLFLMHFRAATAKG